MQVAKAILRHFYGSADRTPPDEIERFSRFEPTAKTAERSEPQHKADFLCFDPGPELMGSSASQRPCPTRAEDAEDDQPPLRRTRFAMSHARTVERSEIRARAIPPAPRPEQFSNEGAPHIPLSVLRRALPHRCQPVKSSAAQASILDDFWNEAPLAFD